MDSNKEAFKKHFGQAADGLLGALGEIDKMKATLSPQQRAEVEKMEKENPIIQEAKEKMKDLNFDPSKWV